jgi:tetraacyldisaccharide-1-P 4'-kinase
LICGIARPGRFIDMVRHAGIIPCAELVFGDHHPYARPDFQDKGELLMKGVITTEKDAVRLASIAMVPIEKMWYLTIALRFSDPADETVLHSMIEKVIR